MRRLIILFCLSLAFAAQSSFAQSPYSAAIKVNERVVTYWELQQRELMLTAFGTRTGVSEQARTQLIEERIFLEAAAELNQRLAPEELQAGMDEFAARGNLSSDQLIQYLAQRGVARESFEAFVRAGLLWRNVVRSQFSEESRVSDEELDRTLSATGGNEQEFLLLSEIIIPVAELGEDGAKALATRLSGSVSSPSAFAAAARRHSRSATARRGGRLDWVPAGRLPAPILAQILTLNTNEVTGPISLNGAYALFQLRGKRTEKSAEVTPTIVQYATAKISNSDSRKQAATARVILGKSDTCLDLRAHVGEDAYNELSSDQSELPDTIGMALAKLDRHEGTSFPNSDGSETLIMLCSRTQELPEGARDELRASLFNRKISSLGAGYLQELKAEAYIEEK